MLSYSKLKREFNLRIAFYLATVYGAKVHADGYSCFSPNAKFVAPCSFSSYSIFVSLYIILFSLCYIKAIDHNSASLLLLGTRPKPMLCMPLSLSGPILLASFLELQ